MRPVLAAVMAFGLMCICSTALAQETRSVSLSAGEQVRLRIEPDTGALSIVSRGPAAPLSEGARMMARSVAEAGPEAMGENSQEVGAPSGAVLEPIVQNEIYIRFIEFGGEHGRLLLIENGYDLALQYSAVLVAGYRLTPTDVCTVRPQLRGLEF